MIPRNRAINRFFINNVRAKKRLEQIILWNEKCTITENSKNIKIAPGDAFNLAKQYKLEYKLAKSWAKKKEVR
jgi:hypothetical protein